VKAGKVDVIVVYKVDRLTRSLADFAKLVELFDVCPLPRMEIDAMEMIAAFLVAITVICFGIGLLQLAIKSSQRRAAAKKLDQLTAATRGYIEALEQSRVFAPVAVPGLHLEQGEFVVRCDRATLGEFGRARVARGGGSSTYPGTRVRAGSFPIYLGTRVRVGGDGYNSVPKEELREVGAGDLVLTNRRLLFIGAHTFAIPFARLLRCEQVDAGLVVSESRWKNPRALLPENPALWYFLVNLVANNQFEGPRLPDDMHISVTGEVPKLRIEILDRGPIKRGILGSPARTRLP
jgi:hypothetical protein